MFICCKADGADGSDMEEDLLRSVLEKNKTLRSLELSGFGVSFAFVCSVLNLPRKYKFKMTAPMILSISKALPVTSLETLSLQVDFLWFSQK